MIKDFLKPSSTDEALKMKKENKNSLYLGGGTKLNNGGKNYKADVYISLEDLQLNGIGKMGDKIKIGSMETLQNIIDSPFIHEFLKTSALGESNRNIRNISTIGGEIAASESWSTTLAGLMAMEAEVETAEEGIFSVDEYVKKGKDSLILNIYLPEITSTLYRNDQRVTANSRPEVTVAVSIGKSGETIEKAVLVLGGVAKTPVRLMPIEEMLLKGELKSADAVQDAVMDEIVQYTENREKGTYLNYISGVLVADCVGRCMR
ncbi:MAG: FAD binding domain-containing protein [Spirochaetaceae bacterium]|nr:FAD binding domain-containing protein [Spirochaetaceae bacterium]